MRQTLFREGRLVWDFETYRPFFASVSPRTEAVAFSVGCIAFSCHPDLRSTAFLRGRRRGD